MKSLKTLIQSYQNEEIEFTEIINYFSKTVNILSSQFKVNNSKWDINSYLWEVSKKINVNNFNCDRALYSYIYKSLFTYCLSLLNNSKKIKIIYNSEVTDLSLDLLNYEDCYEIDSPIIFDNLVSVLSRTQKEIVTLRYKYCFSDSEIAEQLNISRQAVYKSRKNALNRLTKCLVH